MAKPPPISITVTKATGQAQSARPPFIAAQAPTAIITIRWSSPNNGWATPAANELVVADADMGVGGRREQRQAGGEEERAGRFHGLLLLQRIGWWTVTSLVPSGKVASTCTSWIISATPSMTCARVITCAPADIRSATAAAVAGAFDDEIADQRDRLGVVELDAALEPPPGDHARPWR